MPSIQANFWNAVKLNLSQSDLNTEATARLLAEVSTYMNDANVFVLELNPSFSNPLAGSAMLTAATSLINASSLTSGQKTALIAAITSPQ